MGYRNITVDGVKYKYVIGKTHTKIHGVRKVFENKYLGTFYIPGCDCGCYGDEPLGKFDDLSDERKEYWQLQLLKITPADVANAIRSLK